MALILRLLRLISSIIIVCSVWKSETYGHDDYNSNRKLKEKRTVLRSLQQRFQQNIDNKISISKKLSKTPEYTAFENLQLAKFGTEDSSHHAMTKNFYNSFCTSIVRVFNRFFSQYTIFCWGFKES